MKAITDFFIRNSDNLIVGIILLAIPAICYFLRKKITKLITKLFNPYPEGKEERKQLGERIKHKTTNPNDFDYVLNLSMRKIRLNRREKQFYRLQAPAWNASMVEELKAAQEARESFNLNNQP